MFILHFTMSVLRAREVGVALVEERSRVFILQRGVYYGGGGFFCIKQEYCGGGGPFNEQVMRRRVGRWFHG